MRGKYLLLGILLLFFIIIISYEIYETFVVDTTPKVINVPVRINNTCSDPEMSYRINRFDTALELEDPTKTRCPTGYDSNPVQFYGKRYCFIKCSRDHEPSDYYCVRKDNKCHNSTDLSNTIKDSWSQLCAPLSKTNLNLNSTIGSISTVLSTIQFQFNTVNRSYIPFSQTLTNYNGDPIKQSIRDATLPGIISNYDNLNLFKTNIEYNYNELSNKKLQFNSIYNYFNCGSY
jgi:hypothetical protein